MTDIDFDTALIIAAFRLGADKGWRHVSVAAAARAGGLDLAQARASYRCTGMILKKFGEMADGAALQGVQAEGSVQEKLFDMLMRRIDFMQAHRPGVLALLKAAPTCPPMSVALAEMNLVSMGWMLEGAGVDATGLRGMLAKRGLMLVWLYAVQAWARDETEDMSKTMAALDQALKRAEEFAGRVLPSFASAAPGDPPYSSPDASSSLD